MARDFPKATLDIRKTMKSAYSIHRENNSQPRILLFTQIIDQKLG